MPDLSKNWMRIARRLVVATLIYNIVEAVVAIGSGIIARSIALVGFGLDSAIEVTSGITLLWRLRSDSNLVKRESSERVALKIVGFCFVALAVYVSYESLEALIASQAPERTIPGIVLALVSVVVMPILARSKRVVAGQIGSAALVADSKQTSLCTYLSAILLVGLGLNAALGWWWADPIAGLIMVPIIAKEGIDALRGKTCCDCG